MVSFNKPISPGWRGREMIETLKDEIEFHRAYIRKLRELRKGKKMSSQTANSRIESAKRKIKILKIELEKIGTSEMREGRMQILRKIANFHLFYIGNFN